MQKIRWIRVLLTSTGLTLCYFIVLNVYLILTEPIPMQCFDDLTDISTQAEQHYIQGKSGFFTKKMYYNSNTNQWCYFDEVD
ncbi:MAG: hypothetical protein ACRC47_17045 [Shewanella sp.]